MALCKICKTTESAKGRKVCNICRYKESTIKKKGQVCSVCESNLVDGAHSTCSSCRKRPYTLHKKNTCECCGFVPVWKGQLDVDHIDGNHSNNNLDNLQTLCANCHRLKTFKSSSWYVGRENSPPT